MGKTQYLNASEKALIRMRALNTKVWLLGFINHMTWIVLRLRNRERDILLERSFRSV